MAATRRMDRREFMVTTLTVGGGFALALAFPGNPVEAAADNAKDSGQAVGVARGKERDRD